MFEVFTEKAIKATMLAQEESRRLGRNFMGTEHLLLGLLAEGSGIAATVLKSKGLTLDDARVALEERTERSDSIILPDDVIAFTPRTKRVLESAWNAARDLGHNYIGTEHLLLGLVEEGQGLAGIILESRKIQLADVSDAVMDAIAKLTPKPPPTYGPGDVVLVIFKKAVEGQVVSKRRPAVVVADDKGRSEIVVVPLINSSQTVLQQKQILIHANSPEGTAGGLRVDSIVDATVVANIPRRMLVGKMGTLPNEIMEKIHTLVANRIDPIE